MNRLGLAFRPAWATALARVFHGFIGLLALGGAVSPGTADTANAPLRLELPLAKPWNQRTYDLDSPAAFARLVADAELLARLAARQREAWSTQRAEWARATPLAEMNQEQLERYYHRPEAYLDQRIERGLRHLQNLGNAALATTDPAERAELAGLMHEVACAISNHRRPPAPRNLDGVQLPFVLLDHAHNPITKGKRPAAHLDPTSTDVDPSRRPPQPSTFWQEPRDVSRLNLRTGFGRRELPDLTDGVWDYAGPKTSYGGNPGFELVRGRQRLKVKFGETHSEPFTARIFWALGYHVDPTDYVSGLRVRYDRRLLREFHLRKRVQTTFRLFWIIPLHTMQLQKRFNPLDSVARAVLKDGRELAGADLRRQLFLDPDRKHPEIDPANFRVEFEAQIDYLWTVPANVQLEDDRVRSVGPWDFGQLDHRDRRELRGAGLLAAWLGWYDSRFENTRLKIVQREGRPILRHYLSDLGGTLGRGNGFFSGRGELPEEFAWTFTRSRPAPDGSGTPRHFQITGFKPIEDTPPFQAMTIDDARWMARWIAQLTPAQLADALAASGFEPGKVELYLRKLIHRRDQMLLDLGLAGEFPLLGPEMITSAG